MFYYNYIFEATYLGYNKNSIYLVKTLVHKQMGNNIKMLKM